MRQKLILIFYFVFLVILILLLGPGYLLSVVQLIQFIEELNNQSWMPHRAHHNSIVWNLLGNDGLDEIQHFNCPWTITWYNESIKLLKVDFQLRFLDTCGNSPTRESNCLSTIRYRRTSSIIQIACNGTIELLQISRTSFNRITTSCLRWVNGPPILQNRLNKKYG